MKAHFLVTLNLSGLGKNENLSDDALDAYARVINSAIYMQHDFAGLTPDDLSEAGVGVDDFDVRPYKPR